MFLQKYQNRTKKNNMNSNLQTQSYELERVWLNVIIMTPQ